MTTGDFTRSARKDASDGDATPIALMNGEELVTNLIANDIGVRRTPHDLIELTEEEDQA